MHIQNPFNTQSFQPIQPQNPMIMHSYQPTQMQNETPLPYYLQQHEITKNQLSNFSQMPNAAESLQMTMNPYLMGGSSITSNKPLMVFTGTDPEYSVEDYLNAVFAIIYSYISILEKTEVQSTLPIETSKHTKVRNEITIFSTFRYNPRKFHQY